jgi:hypothetical protein|tara:strand:+ start:11448 stop:11642 length:195 start_codon:yes stop_codon:yes gene_type:complete
MDQKYFKINAQKRNLFGDGKDQNKDHSITPRSKKSEIYNALSVLRKSNQTFTVRQIKTQITLTG